MWFFDIQLLHLSLYSYLKMIMKVIKFVKSTNYNLMHTKSWRVSGSRTERDQGLWKAQTASTVASALTIEKILWIYPTRSHCFNRKRVVSSKQDIETSFRTLLNLHIWNIWGLSTRKPLSVCLPANVSFITEVIVSLFLCRCLNSLCYMLYWLVEEVAVLFGDNFGRIPVIRY